MIPDFQQLINGVNQFTFDLYQQMKAKRGNLFLSPYNVAIGMNMVGLEQPGKQRMKYIILCIIH